MSAALQPSGVHCMVHFVSRLNVRSDTSGGEKYRCYYAIDSFKLKD